MMTKHLLPEREFNSDGTMVEALSRIFNTETDELRLAVRDLFNLDDAEVQNTVGPWLESCGITRKEYLWKIVNKKVPCDGLFVWLASQAKRQHINVFHASGIWTTRKPEIVVMTDPGIILVLKCFLSVAPITLAMLKKDSEYIDSFKDPREVLHKYVMVPKILNKPVVKLGERLEEIGFHPVGCEQPLQCLLADLLGTTVDVSREQLRHWIICHNNDVHMIEKWLAVRGLDLSEYLTHLEMSGCVMGWRHGFSPLLQTGH